MAWFSHMLLHLRAPRNDYLHIALVISVAVHAALLAIRFAPAPAPQTVNPALSVILVNTATEQAPEDPQWLAQSNLLAGGTDDEGISSSPLPRTVTATDSEVVLADLRQRQEELEQQQQKLLTQLEAALEVARSRRDFERNEDSRHPGTDARDQESVLLSARIAALRERIEHYNRRPRVHFSGPSAQADVYAHYLEAWRTRIEQLGTEHYPDEARGRLYGSLQLTVYIRHDGSLERVEFERASEHAVLNLAAQRIVQLAAPFPPLPPAIAGEVDILAITRTWHFQNRTLETH